MIKTYTGTVQDSDAVRRIIGKDQPYKGGPVDFYIEKRREFDPVEDVFCLIPVDSGQVIKKPCGQVVAKVDGKYLFIGNNGRRGFGITGLKRDRDNKKIFSELILADSEDDIPAIIDPSLPQQTVLGAEGKPCYAMIESNLAGWKTPDGSESAKMYLFSDAKNGLFPRDGLEASHNEFLESASRGG